jgi:hypothetical protein
LACLRHPNADPVLSPVSPVLAGTLQGSRTSLRISVTNDWSFLRKIIPKLSCVAVFTDLTNVTERIGLDEIESTAGVLKLQTQRFELEKVEDFDSQFQAIMK